MSQPFKQEGYDLIAAAFEVYNELGYGMAEAVYQESIEEELRLRGIPFDAKRELSIWFKGQKLNKKYVPDLYVFDGLVVELKAVARLNADHEAQLFNYLRIARKPAGYLLNFGVGDGLEWKRYVLSDLK